MTQVILTLYEDHDTTVEVLDELRHAGFDETQVEIIESRQNERHYRLRRLDNGAKDQILDGHEVKEALMHMEIADDDADDYVEQINQGAHLVLVRSDDEISGRAKQILNQFPFIEEIVHTSYSGEHVVMPSTTEKRRHLSAGH